MSVFTSSLLDYTSAFSDLCSIGHGSGRNIKREKDQSLSEAVSS